MTGIAYNSPTCYANLGFDNWPTQNPAAPLNGVNAMLLTSAYTPNVLADAQVVRAQQPATRQVVWQSHLVTR
jgi:hypothetical protein